MINFSGFRSSSLAGKLLRLPLRLIPASTQVRVLQGPLRGARWIAGSATHGCWLGSYEIEKQRAFVEHIAPGQVVFDIGANVGFYSLLAARYVGDEGSVIAFEPLPRNVEFLRWHKDKNKHSNIEIIEAAVGDASGTAQFAAAPDPSMGSVREDGDLRVRLLCLDAMCAAGELPLPDLIKIDVEGAELSVLRGASHVLKSSAPLIFLATHGPGIHQECVSFLQSIGYITQPLVGDSVTDSDELLCWSLDAVSSQPRTGDQN